MRCVLEAETSFYRLCSESQLQTRDCLSNKAFKEFQVFMQEFILCCIIWLEEKVGGGEVTLAFLEPAESTYAISLKHFLPDSAMAVKGWGVQWVIPWIWICTEGLHILVICGNEDCSPSTRGLVLAWRSVVVWLCLPILLLGDGCLVFFYQ